MTDVLETCCPTCGMRGVASSPSEALHESAWSETFLTRSLQREMFLAARTMQKTMNALIAPLCQQEGITLQQMHVLIVLQNEPGQTAGQVSDNAGVLRGNFAPLCHRLEKKGLVRRERRLDDVRSVRLYVTPVGESVLAALDESVRRRFAEVLRNEEPSTIVAIATGLAALSDLSSRMVF